MCCQGKTSAGTLSAGLGTILLVSLLLLVASRQDGEGGKYGAARVVVFLLRGRGVPTCSSNPAGEPAKRFVVLLNSWKCIYS